MVVHYQASIEELKTTRKWVTLSIVEDGSKENEFFLKAEIAVLFYSNLLKSVV